MVSLSPARQAPARERLTADEGGEKRQEDREADSPGRDAVRARAAQLRRRRADRRLGAVAADLHGAALRPGARAGVVGGCPGGAARPAAAGLRDVEVGLEQTGVEQVGLEALRNGAQPRALRPCLHQFLLIPRNAGVGLCQFEVLFLRPTGLADGLALKEMRYAANGDSPHGPFFRKAAASGSPAPRPSTELRRI